MKSESNFKVLILVPDLALIGGISNYYGALKKYFPENILYFRRGSRGFNNIIARSLILISDIIKFCTHIVLERPTLIIINSSVSRSGMLRDSVYIFLSRLLLKAKCVVFFRGWDSTFFRNYIDIPKYVKMSFMKSDAIIVLSQKFKSQLISIGYVGEIIVETTTVDDALLEYFKPKDFFKKNFSILFMSRIEKDKGVLELIEAVAILVEKYNLDLTLNIAGDGGLFDNVNRLVSNNRYSFLKVHGFVKNKQKASLLAEASLFVFPSTHDEGMPNAVLEAISFGVPILTTAVGGIVDFFEEDKMGNYLRNTDPFYLSQMILSKINQPSKLKEISNFNYQYAKDNFYSSAVANRMISYIEKLINMY